MKKIFLLLFSVTFLLTLVIGCSNSDNSSEENEEKELTETTTQEKDQQDIEETEDKSIASVIENTEDVSEENSLPENEAKAIAEKFYNDLIATIENNDYESFKNLSSKNMDENLVKQEFQAFISFVNNGQADNLDIEIMLSTDEVLFVSYYLYTNLEAGSASNHSSAQFKLSLEKEDGEWKYSLSEKAQKVYDTYLSKLSDKFGEDYVNTGYVNGDHTFMFDKVLRNNLSVDIYKMKPNSDNSLELELAITNGYPYNVYDIAFKELILYSGQNEVPFTDLSGYELDPAQIIKSKDIFTISLYLTPEDLLVPADQIDFTYAGAKSSISNKY